MRSPVGHDGLFASHRLSATDYFLMPRVQSLPVKKCMRYFGLEFGFLQSYHFFGWFVQAEIVATCLVDKLNPALIGGEQNRDIHVRKDGIEPLEDCLLSLFRLFSVGNIDGRADDVIGAADGDRVSREEQCYWFSCPGSGGQLMISHRLMVFQKVQAGESILRIIIDMKLSRCAADHLIARILEETKEALIHLNEDPITKTADCDGNRATVKGFYIRFE